MKLRSGVLFMVASGVVGLSLWGVAQAAPVGSVERLAAASAVVAPLVGDEEKAEYVGSSKCKKCHMAQYKSWSKETHMAKAFDSLKAGEKSEAKGKAGLDPSKDYTKDETCLKCHVTGYGEHGGYAIPDPEDKKALKRAKKMAGVGCESCHGPGGEYIKLQGEIMKSKRTYKVEEMYEAGLQKVTVQTCTACHNDKSPTFNADEPFDFEKKKEEDSHEHVELKQREG